MRGYIALKYNDCLQYCPLLVRFLCAIGFDLIVSLVYKYNMFIRPQKK